MIIQNSFMSIVFCTVLFFAMVGVSYAVYRRRRAFPSDISESTKLVMSSLVALLGLLIAFSFSSAYSRLDVRRQCIADEANVIGTAYYRVDLLPRVEQEKMRALFRAYLDVRITYFKRMANAAAINTALAETQTLQKSIWTLAVDATSGPTYDTARRMFLPALNAMFDITTTRAVVQKTHIPAIILAMLFVLPLLCAYMIGDSAGRTGTFLYPLLFAFMICFVIYVILDIDHPRFGAVRLDQAHQQLENLKSLIN